MAGQEKSADQLQDQDERTNSMGLFNMAEAYRLSAEALRKAGVAAGHAESPIRFLYYHAIELYLKALLRLRDHQGGVWSQDPQARGGGREPRPRRRRRGPKTLRADGRHRRRHRLALHQDWLEDIADHRGSQPNRPGPEK